MMTILLQNNTKLVAFVATFSGSLILSLKIVRFSFSFNSTLLFSVVFYYETKTFNLINGLIDLAIRH